MFYPRAWRADIALNVPGDVNFTARGLKGRDHVFDHRHLLDVLHTVPLTLSLQAPGMSSSGSSGQNPWALLRPTALRIEIGELAGTHL